MAALEHPKNPAPHPVASASPVALFAVAWWVLAYFLGLGLQLRQAALWPASVYATLLALGLAALYLGFVKPKRWRSILLACACALLAFSITGLRAHHTASKQIRAADEGQDFAVIATIDDMPRETDYGYSFHATLEPARQVHHKLPTLVRLSWYTKPSGAAQSASAPQAGQRWRMTVRLRAVHGSSNPHGFDYELYAWQRGLGALGYVRSGKNDPPPVLLKDSIVSKPIERLRGWIAGRITKTVNPQGEAPVAAGLLTGLSVGEQAAISGEDWAVFRDTGVAHLISISGVHITMFAWLAQSLLLHLWRFAVRHFSWGLRLGLRVNAHRLAWCGALALAFAYALLSGYGVPAQRTILMLAAFTGLKLLGLHWPWYSTWTALLVLITLFDHYAVLQAGFWLSFVAVAVLFASDHQNEPPNVAPETHTVHKVSAQAHRAAKEVWLLQRQQWVITLALAPLSVLFFHQVSLVGLLANILAIPWVTLVLTPLSLLGIFIPALWHAAAWAAELCMNVLSWMAALPFGVWKQAAAPWWLNLAAILGSFLAILPLPLGLRLAFAAPLLPLLLWRPTPLKEGEFRALFLDVGQGASVLISTRNKHLLYDTGPRYNETSDAGARVVTPLLQALGVNLDRLVISHVDSDHAGGEASVRAAHSKAKVYGSGKDWGADHQACTAGESWTWDGVTFQFLSPRAADYAPGVLVNPRTDSNAMSCVLRVDNGRTSVLLTGDIPEAVEAQLTRDFAQTRRLLETDILLAPHHGSKTSSSALFLDYVRPRTAVIQMGYRNRYQHPHPSVVERYQGVGVRLVDTVQCGAWTWVSNTPTDNPSQGECNRTTHRRYWQHQAPLEWRKP